MTIPNMIHSFARCKKCVTDGKRADIEAGLTPYGLQIWCKRHNINVFHFTIEELKEQIKTPKCACCDGDTHGA